jgi:hypothetical protein
MGLTWLALLVAAAPAVNHPGSLLTLQLLAKLMNQAAPRTRNL